MNVVKFSVSSNQSKKTPKLYTYGFKVATAVSLDDIIGNANRYAISGPKYKGGHRKGENIIAGSNIILIDCDEPGQAEAVEAKIQHYDYVKVPSASNSEEKPYKWHFIIPTTEPLSVYPAAMQWQVEQFFRQVGITDDMIDTTGSYDIARQFAPASIDMTIEEADDLSEVHHSDMELQAPVSEPPAELKSAAAKSVDLNITGIDAADLPAEHLWFKGNAIAYPDAINAVRVAYSTRESEDDKIIVSGFGCPHDNHHHTGDRTQGYGFAFIGSDGDVVVKCTGSHGCDEHPIFVVPEKVEGLEVEKSITITEYDKSVAPQIVLTFENHWENNLCNISSPALLKNWHNNFDAFDEVIGLNQRWDPGMKICCPSPTGSGKTQQITHKAIDLFGSDVRTLIVTERTEAADIIASQIKTYTHDDYVAVLHSNDVSIQGVRKVKDPVEAQCLIITHEKFRRQEETITKDRDFIAVDEAIDVISHTQITEDDLLNIIKIIEKFGDWKYKNKDPDKLQSELRMMKQILEIQFEAFKKSEKSFIGLRAGSVPDSLDMLPSLTFSEVIKLMSIDKLKPSIALTGMHNKKMDEALKAKYIKISETMLFFFKQFNFMTRSGKRIAWNTASELIPGKSLVVMDATASVNKAYELYIQYQPERLKVLPVIDCRDYSNVMLHTVRTNTGRNTILGDNGFKDGEENEVLERVQKFIANMKLNSEPGDDILIVSFRQLDPSLITYAESLDDRTIYIDHWGNLTGTNKYQYCNKIFLYGLNHKSEEIHRSLHALIKSPTEAFRDTEENNYEMKLLITSDLIAEVIQAINRILCRRVIDNKGNCDRADVYLTLLAGYDDAQIMMTSIKSEMLNIQTSAWNISEEDGVKLARVFSIEAFMIQLDVMLNDKTLEVTLDEVLETLGMTKEQYRLNIKKKAAFKRAIDASPFFIEHRQKIDRRGRSLKTKDQVFVIGVKK